MKKKVVAVMMMLTMAVSLAACGSDGGGSGETQSFEEGKAPEDYTGTLNVWSWTDDPKYQIEAFKKVYPNVEIEFTQIGEDYNTKMQTIIDNETEGPDVFCADVKAVKGYIESGAFDNLSDAPYNADASDIMDYVVEMGSDSEGNLRALSWQATPGGFWYRRSLAKEFFGTDDPAKISEMMSSMDGIYDMAKTIYEKSNGKTYFTTNYEDLWTMAVYSMREEPWIVDNKLTIDPYVEEFYDTCKYIRENNVDAKLEPWSEGWYSAAANGTVFGYILPTWGMQYVIQPGGPDTEGDWAIASMPKSYFDGGTYMGIYSLSKEKELAWEYVKFVTLNEDYLTQYAKDKADFPANEKVIDSLTENYEDSWCGGQNTFQFFKEEAEKIDTKLISSYDEQIGNMYMDSISLYVNGDATKEEALAQFKEDVRRAYQYIEVE